MTQTLSLSIDGMHCASCVQRVEEALVAVSGVGAANANLATGRVTVSGDDLAADEVQGALRSAGYPAQTETVIFDVDGMHCASCVGRVEGALAATPGVTAASVSLATGQARIESLGGTETVEAALSAIASAGYAGHRHARGTDGRQDTSPAARFRAEAQAMARRAALAGALTLPVFLVEMGSHLIEAIHMAVHQTIGASGAGLLGFVLATLVLAGPGRGFFLRGLPQLFRGRPDMDALVALGTGAAWGFSSVSLFLPGVLPEGAGAFYFEAAAVIVTLILVGRWLEARAKARAGDAVAALVGLAPDTAEREVGGSLTEVPLAEVMPGDILAVRPGGRIPTDGRLTEGTALIDESMLTGEPLPVTRAPGDPLTGGTLNGPSLIRMEVTGVGADTALARIVAAVETAQATRLPVQNLVNRITAWFVPAVLLIAALTFLAWLLLGPEPQLTRAIVAAVSVLIVACPCAMGLAVPASIAAASGRGAKAGLLFRQGDALQRLASVGVVAFDKTGTLTEGQPVVSETAGADETLALAAAIESGSEHPLARAIVDEAKRRGAAVPTARDITATPGEGADGLIGDTRVAVGNAAMMAGIDMGGFGALADDMARAGKTPVFVARDDAVIGLIAISDQTRPGAKRTIERLRTAGIATAVITGDRVETAQTLAHELGISDVRAGVRPEGKADAVADLRARHGSVAFVGDGLNDAPALAAADVGIAIGAGTDIAIEAADVVLMLSDPEGGADAIELSRKTLSNIRQNLGWAFGYNILLIPVAAGLLWPVAGITLTPALAAVAMALSSVAVVSNALRLLALPLGRTHA